MSDKEINFIAYLLGAFVGLSVVGLLYYYGVIS